MSSALLYVQAAPYRSVACQRLQMAVLVQTIFTYLAANVFYVDPRTQLGLGTRTLFAADVVLVAANTAFFIVLAFWLCVGVRTSLQAERLLYKEDGPGMMRNEEVMAPRLRKFKHHLFISHAWKEAGQDVARGGGSG